MPDSHWENLKGIFHAAIALSPDKRQAYLDQVCMNDSPLRVAVESLLRSHEETRNFMDLPGFEAAAEMLIEGTELRRGTLVAHYRILSRLGEGGMGRVYLAEDVKLRRQVALKFLPTNLAQDEERMRRFEQEARAASALNHPNILTIHEISDVDGHRFIATEFIEGQTLRERLRSDLDTDDALEIAIQVASALVVSHRVNIIHRDIKPENIMIRKDDGLVKVLDFGLAKMRSALVAPVDSAVDIALIANTEPGVVMGTAAYMSPEQARGDSVDERTDIWSLGVVLYEMIAGCSPFVAGTSNEIISGILSKEPPPPITRHSRVVPERLEEIVEKALAKNKGERYQTSKDLLIDLKRLQQTLQLKAVSERGSSPDRVLGSPSGGDTVLQNAPLATTLTPAASSAEYIVNKIKSHKRAALISLALLILIIATAFVYIWRVGRTASSQTEIKSIAVLPLKNLSGDVDQEYFAEGITDELTTELARISSLRVISHTSAKQYAADKKTIGEIGRELDVDTAVEGTVLRSGDRVRVSVQLIDTRSDSHLWAESYERDLRDVLTMQDEIAAAIVREIRVKLTPNERLWLSTPQPVNPAAHDAFLRGVYEWNRWDQGARNAVEYFAAATRLDPTYSAAYAGLANAYSHFGIMGMLPPETAWPKAKAAALKALELNESSAEAHAALGYVKQMYDWDWAGAERDYIRAIELNPNYATAHHWYGLLLAEKGRFDEGIRETQRAEDLDPLSTLISASVGRRFYLARRYDEAIAQFQKTLQMNPNFGLALSGLGAAYIQVRRYPEAIAVLQKAETVAKDNPESLPMLGFAYAVSDDRAHARAVLEELQNQAKSHYVSPYFTAVIRAGMGETDGAVRDLQQAVRDRSNWVNIIGTEPVLDNLRSDPRFKDLVGRVGLPQ